MSNEIVCPKCGSSQLSANKQGFSLGKAAKGVAVGLVGIPGGVLWGFKGSDKITITCLACGKTFKPGEGKTNHSHSSNIISNISQSSSKVAPIDEKIIELYELEGRYEAIKYCAFANSMDQESAKTHVDRLIAANQISSNQVYDSNYVNKLLAGDKEKINQQIEFANKSLEEAIINLEQLKKFQLGRSKEEKEKQIQEHEEFIQNIQGEISEWTSLLDKN